MNEVRALAEALEAARLRGQRCALATVVEVKGSAYRRAGARMLFVEDGCSVGMISGGCLDGDLWKCAREVIESGCAALACYDTTSSEDIIFGLGLGCRGVVKILIEPVENLEWLAPGSTVEVLYEGEDLGTRASRSTLLDSAAPRRSGVFIQHLEAPQRLLLFGAGQDAVPLHAMAQLVGFEVEVFDNRAPSSARVPLLPSRYYPIERLEPHLNITPETACVIMTHNFLFDLELLKLLLPSPARYVGLLGPRRRANELLEKMSVRTLLPAVELGDADLQKLHAPIGLDIGAETPEEIALSILAELRAASTGRNGGFLRARETAIHSEASA
jgi:xanthine dehydrogenase accessory factor